MVRLLNVYTISAFAALGGALLGFDISSMSGIIGTDHAMAGGSFVGALSSRLSRKVAIQIGAALWCIGAAVQSASNGIVMLVIGRVLAGLCVGLTSSLVPIYQSEIAPRKIRGRIVSLQQFAITWGILVQYFIEYGCSFLDSTASFRVPWAIQTVPAVVLFVGLFWFPRSPRWLASKDRWDEALRVLAFLPIYMDSRPPCRQPACIRAKSVALATASNWASNFALGFAVPPLLRCIQWRLFFVFGSFNMAAFIHVWFTAPETKQRTLEELDEIFEYGEPLWKSFLGGQRGSNKLDMLAKDIEMGVLRINRSAHMETKHGINENIIFRS
ncbi:hypothetical protein V1505DRAFT_417036 [Lipomyces doorenjongii]